MIEAMRRRRKVRLARRIAREIAAWGGPGLTGLPDDELVRRIEVALNAWAAVSAEAGVSAREAAEALTTAMRDAMPWPRLSEPPDA